MEEDKDALTTLSKWPFYLGDLILVATGIAIAILNEGNLSNWQVASCVVSVALGAGLFVLPHVVEYQVRVVEERSDRRAEIRILRRQLEALEDELQNILVPLRDVEPRIRLIAQSNDLVSAAVDQQHERIDALERGQANGLAPIAAQLEQITGEFNRQQTQLDRLQSLGGRIRALQDALASQAEATGDVKDWTPELESLQSSLISQINDLQQKMTDLDARLPVKNDRPLRKRQKPESRLLHRAMTDHSSAKSTAVSRIIEAKGREEPENTESAQADEAKGAGHDAVEADEPLESAAEVVSEVEDTQATADATESENDSNEVIEASQPASVASEQSVETQDSGVAEEDALGVNPEETEAVTAKAPQSDFFGDSVTTAVPTRSRVKKRDTVVEAEIFIGIGNKPYLRGSGGGLSWEQGILMDFEEIGKWRWVASHDTEEPIELQIFRNDEEPDRKGKFSVEPGAKLVIEPKFD